jgi:hypothetical protein
MQNMLGAAERLPDIDHPCMPVERMQELRECTRLLQPLKRTVEREFLSTEEALQSVCKLSSEDLTEHDIRQEEAGAFRTHPALTPGSEAPGRHDAVDVRMVTPPPTIP